MTEEVHAYSGYENLTKGIRIAYDPDGARVYATSIQTSGVVSVTPGIGPVDSVSLTEDGYTLRFIRYGYTAERDWIWTVDRTLVVDPETPSAATWTLQLWDGTSSDVASASLDLTQPAPAAPWEAVSGACTPGLEVTKDAKIPVLGAAVDPDSGALFVSVGAEEGSQIVVFTEDGGELSCFSAATLETIRVNQMEFASDRSLHAIGLDPDESAQLLLTWQDDDTATAVAGTGTLGTPDVYDFHADCPASTEPVVAMTIGADDILRLASSSHLYNVDPVAEKTACAAYSAYQADDPSTCSGGCPELAPADIAALVDEEGVGSVGLLFKRDDNRIRLVPHFWSWIELFDAEQLAVGTANDLGRVKVGIEAEFVEAGTDASDDYVVASGGTADLVYVPSDLSTTITDDVGLTAEHVALSADGSTALTLSRLGGGQLLVYDIVGSTKIKALDHTAAGVWPTGIATWGSGTTEQVMILDHMNQQLRVFSMNELTEEIPAVPHLIDLAGPEPGDPAYQISDTISSLASTTSGDYLAAFLAEVGHIVVLDCRDGSCDVAQRIRMSDYDSGPDCQHWGNATVPRLAIDKGPALLQGDLRGDGDEVSVVAMCANEQEPATATRRATVMQWDLDLSTGEIEYEPDCSSSTKCMDSTSFYSASADSEYYKGSLVFYSERHDAFFVGGQILDGTAWGSSSLSADDIPFAPGDGPVERVIGEGGAGDMTLWAQRIGDTAAGFHEHLVELSWSATELEFAEGSEYGLFPEHTMLSSTYLQPTSSGWEALVTQPHSGEVWYGSW